MSKYDYVVIGAGSAGAIIATRLAEDPDTNVLLLEAGGSDRTTFVRKPGMISLVQQIKQLKKKFDWGFKTVPQTNLNGRQIPYTRGKVLGGSSSVNGMLYLRGNHDNYDRWAAAGCEGWSHDDVLPYYKRLESHEDGETAYHGGSGPIHVTRHPVDQLSPVSQAFMTATSAVCGIPVLDDFNAENQHCVSTYHMSAKNGVRSSTAEGYVQPNRDKPNFTIEVHAHVHRIVIENGRAVGVEYERDGEVHIASAAREVVLSAGAVGSPQILMLSGVGPADHLRAHDIAVHLDLPGVGRNLHDHLFVPLVFRAQTSLHRGTAAHFLGGMLKEYLFGNSWFGRTVFEAGAFIKTRDDQPIPNLQVHTLPWGYPDPNQDGPERPSVDPGNCLCVMPTLIYPKSRGELLLTSNDPRAAPHIDPHFLEEREDLQVFLDGIRRCREICAHPAMSDHLHEELTPGALKETDADLVDEIRLRATTVYHPVGTCKMGVDDMAVVDPTLRVCGVDGLRVADASIMPEVTGGNTNAPSMMIGERAAALIRAA